MLIYENIRNYKRQKHTNKLAQTNKQNEETKTFLGKFQVQVDDFPLKESTASTTSPPPHTKNQATRNSTNSKPSLVGGFNPFEKY